MKKLSPIVGGGGKIKKKIGRSLSKSPNKNKKLRSVSAKRRP